MVIDFHTHTFPDRIAKASIDSLSKCSGITPHTDGTVKGLADSMAEGGVDFSVILPVMTKESQFETVNHAAAAICEAGNGLLSFGGIHPDCSEIRQKMREIKALGLKGIKIHPAYQKVYMDDIRYLRIIRAHGAERILFGTDCPWSGQRESVERLERLPLSAQERQLIFSENAKKLLGLEG